MNNTHTWILRTILIVGLIVTVVALSGCGSDYPDDYESWSGESVEKSDNFTVNYDSDVIDGPLIAHIEDVWLDVQSCAGIPTRAGLVIEYTSQNKIKDGKRGYIIYADRYIRVRDTDLKHDDKTLRHEFVHWILRFAGVSAEDNSNHNSPFFDVC